MTDIYRQLQRRAHAWRNPILALAAVAFAAALAVSIDHLQVGFEDIEIVPLAILLVVLGPLHTAYSASNIVVMGSAARAPIPFRPAMRINVYAQLAELLPIPGGAIVRAGAMMRAGATAARSTEIILAFSLMWIACAAVGAGLALMTGAAGQLILLAGALGVLSVFAWTWTRLGAAIAVTALALRTVGLMLVAVRMIVCFAVIGMTIDASAGFGFAFATILGSAASLVPAGLGVSEALSTLMAGPIGVNPAAAFLAVAIGRITGLAGNAMLAAIFAAWPGLVSARTGPPVGDLGRTGSRP